MPVRRIIKNIRFFRPFCLKGNLLTDGAYPARKNNSLALKRQKRQFSQIIMDGYARPARAAHSLYHKIGKSVAIILGFCRFQNFGGKNQRKLRKCGYISSVIFSILLRLERLVHISKRFYPQMWITFPLYVDNYVK